MRVFKFLSLALLLVFITSCSGVDKKIKKMVPKDAFVVMNFNPKALIEHSGAEISDEGVIKNLPQSLKNEMGPQGLVEFEKVCKAIAKLGVDTDNKIYAYVTQDAMPVVALVPLKNQDDTKAVFEDGSLGQKFSFTKEDGMEIAVQGNAGIALKDNIMLVGMTQDASSFKSQARKQFEADFTNISECEGADECLDNDNDANCYVNMSKLTGLMGMFAGQIDPSIASIVTLLSDMKAIALTANLADNTMKVDSKFFMDDNSDLAKLMQSAFTTGDASFLQYVPANMDMVAVFNIKGKNIAEFEQVKKLIDMINQDPTARAMNLGGMLASINGPVYLAADYGNEDPSQFGEVVFGFKTNKAADFVRLVGSLVREANVPATLSNNIYSFSLEKVKVDAGVKGNDMAFVKVRMPDAGTTESGIDAQEASKLFAGVMTGSITKLKIGDYTLCASGAAKDIKKSSGEFYILGKDGKKLPFIYYLDVMMTVAKNQEARYRQYMQQLDSYSSDDEDMAYAGEEQEAEMAY